MAVLTKKKKIGYGFGIFTESLLYNMFYTYYLTFLIEIAGIKPSLASIVIFFSIAWDAVTDPMIGNYTDRPGVSKRKIMKISIIPLAVVFVVAWTNFASGIDSQAIKVLLYTILTMVIWVFYTMYTIPYYAVVAELTDDYDERTNIRSTASLINAAAVGLGNILPALVPTIAIALGEKYKSNAYAVIAFIISVIAIVAGFVCTKSLKGVYSPKPVVEGEKTESIKDVFKSFAEIFKLKPTKWFMLFVFFFLAASSLIQSNLTYMVIDCIGIDYDSGISIVIISLVLSMGITVPIVEKVAERKDRRFASIVFLSIAFTLLVVYKIVGLDLRIAGLPVMAVLVPAALGISTGTFWTFFYSMGYDLVELNEFVTGERRESTITALPQFIQKFGSATGILLAGQLLTAYGYDSTKDVAGQEALIQKITDQKIISGMENITTLFPAICMGIAIICLILYPVTRERFEALKTQLAKKNAGEEYSTDGFEKLM